jgi:hypothetical protein
MDSWKKLQIIRVVPHLLYFDRKIKHSHEITNSDFKVVNKIEPSASTNLDSDASGWKKKIN